MLPAAHGSSWLPSSSICLLILQWQKPVFTFSVESCFSRLSSLLWHGLQVSFELLCFLTSLYEQWTGNRTNVSQNETLAFRSESANLSSFAMEASPHYRYSPSPAAVYLDPLFILLQLFPKDSETLQFFLLSPK